MAGRAPLGHCCHDAAVPCVPQWKRVYSAEDKDCQEESKDASATFLHYSFAVSMQADCACIAVGYASRQRQVAPGRTALASGCVGADSMPTSGAPPDGATIADTPHPLQMRVQQAAICTASIALFAAMMWGVYSVARIVVHVVWRPMPPVSHPAAVAWLCVARALPACALLYGVCCALPDRSWGCRTWPYWQSGSRSRF